ncbi:PBS lyase [Phormidesmis priestleyi ULC007]|uniref:PBS lyase n=1 Tax=Phormidesmis priestleyi ULC007 TaxID=1920490 RepID=A0A2T1DIQ3_9CYAN|nr:HEAT repeat domain-containing protein [Phormidesmis priestleyi]PSB20314.1 PBS lyase [Phormidesmis priestleyi ULC007]PZO50183.1 MAG: PBS lyase [Phormidesmis priestleyi]
MQSNYLETLQQAQTAAAHQDWALLNHYLQQLLGEESSASPTADPFLLLNLALQSLESGDFQDRWNVAKLFPSFAEAAIAPLLDLLQNQDADSEAQWFAIRILGGFNHPQVVTALVDLLKTSTNEELNGMTVTALANLGSGTIEILAELLNQDNTRRLATQTLAQIRRPETVPLLEKVVNDEDAQVRALAIEALSSFHNPEISRLLIQALKDPAVLVRRAAVTGLGFCGADLAALDLVSHLHPLLLDLNLEVCRQTAIALGRLGTLSATNALFESLQSLHTPEFLAIELIRALGWIGTSEALHCLERSLIQLPLAESVRQEILTVLGRVDQPEQKRQATQILLDLLQQEGTFARSASARQAIALTLGQLGDLAALDSLINLLADPNVSVRLHVISALKTLAPDSAHQRLEQLSESENSGSELGRGVAIALQEWQL